MLKVLAVIPSGSVYGLQNMTLDLIRGLSGKGVHFHFLITRWTDGQLAKRLDECEIPYTYSWMGMFSRKLDWVNLKMTACCLLKLPELYRDYSALVKAYQPHLIYIANYHELILLAPLFKTGKIPVLNHMHDPPPSIPFQRILFRFWDRLVNKYLAVSRSVQRRLEELGASPDKISLLENGIDLSLFGYRPKRSEQFARLNGWPHDSVILGMTGQMIETKGHMDLIEAVGLLCKDHADIRLVIGGDPNGPYYQKLVSELARRGMTNMTSFSGWQDDIRNFFSGIDILVMPSRHEEGFGLVAAQAMATGLPVVATRGGGLSEVVENEITGILVEKRSPRMLAEAVSRLARSPQMRQSMGKAGRRRIKERFDLSKQAARFEAILKDLAHV